MLKGEQIIASRTVLGLILAGGSSQRLGGGDKALQPLGQHSILHQICARLKPQVEHAVLSANSDPAFFKSFGHPVIDDGEWRNCGPLAGILAGCRYAQKHNYRSVMSVAGDTPFYPQDLLQNFLHVKQQSDADVIFARSAAGEHPTFALWPATIADQLENWLKETKRRSIRVFAGNHSIAYADFNAPDTSSGLDPFFNINTQSELTKARAAWQLHRPE